VSLVFYAHLVVGKSAITGSVITNVDFKTLRANPGFVTTSDNIQPSDSNWILAKINTPPILASFGVCAAAGKKTGTGLAIYCKTGTSRAISRLRRTLLCWTCLVHVGTTAAGHVHDEVTRSVFANRARLTYIF